nr:winged helix-turn-helix domain-containing protein [Fournierella massiliensis]
MERHVMRVETFGGLAVWLDDQPLVRHGKRINKNLELLALLAINGRAPLSNEALAGLLWTGEESHNPAGTLKNAAYSLRRLLEQRGAGRELITVEDKQYRLAGDLVLEVDLWRAGQLAEQAVNQPDPARALEAWQELDGICCGDFLPQLADRPWVAGQASLVRSGWLAAARRAAALLLDGPERTGARQALAVCAEALLIFPDDMGLQIIRFAAMQRLNMKAAVRSQYPLLAERLMERQGQAPPARLRAIHQWATEGESRGREEMLRIRQKLANHEKNAPPGPYFCEYDQLPMLYAMARRQAARNGQTTVLLLVSAESQPGSAAAGPDQKLRFLLSQTLRRDDVCCRYGHDQYLALLMLADPAHTDAVEHRLRAGWKPVNGRLELMFDFGGPLPQIASE